MIADDQYVGRREAGPVCHVGERRRGVALPHVEVTVQKRLRLGEVGIRKIVNGPFTFAPDGNPLVGPVPGLRNFWVACGVMAGFSQGGGVGLSLASWMVEGDPGADIWAMDVARYGD